MPIQIREPETRQRRIEEKNQTSQTREKNELTL
jgi:hypothetical protein